MYSEDEFAYGPFCKYKGHQEFIVQFLCTYEQCNMSRLGCQQCLDDGIHAHSNNQNLIMNLEEVLDKLQTDREKLQNNFLSNQEAIQLEHFLQQMLKELQKLKRLIITLEKNVHQYIDTLTYQDDIKHLSSLTMKLEGPEFRDPLNISFLSNRDIDKWLNINYKQFDYKVQPFKDGLNIIQQQLNKILQNEKDYQERKLLYQDLKKYDIQQIQVKKNDFCFDFDNAIISNNKQYLVYSQSKAIHIQDIKLNKVCQSIYLRKNLFSIKFTLDSQYLFVGDYEGFVYGLFVQNNFKQFYKQKIHKDIIKQIKIIQRSIITCSSGAIIKTDFIKKQQIFKLEGVNYNIKSFDYNDSKDVICVSHYSNIQIWDCQNKSTIIDQRGSYLQAQFIDNKQNLLLLDDQGILLKYKIDYLNKQLVKLDKFQENKRIFRFQQLDDKYLLLVYQYYCKIFNNDEFISTIYHYLEFQANPYQNIEESTDDLKYIVLHDKGVEYNIIVDKLYLAKALN